MDYNDENDELIDNDEYDDDEDYDEELEDSLGDEVSFCIFVLFLPLWYFPDFLAHSYFSARGANKETKSRII